MRSGLRLISIGNSVPSCPTAEQFVAAPHGPGSRLGPVSRPVGPVRLPEPFGHELLDGLAQELGAFVSEQFFGSAVHEDDLAGLVGHDHAVGSRVDKTPDEIVAESKLRQRS